MSYGQYTLVLVLAVLLQGCLSFHTGPIPDAPPSGKKDIGVTHYVELEGSRIHYLEAGEGPAVVLIHGFASSMDAWNTVIEPLSQHRRVIALDLKGFGYSDRAPGDYSPAAQARIVNALMEHVGAQTFEVVAHSWGASVALKLALQEPEKVDKLALYDAWVYYEQLPTFFQWARAPFLGDMMFALWYRERPQDKIAGAFYDPRFVTQELVDTVEADLSIPGVTAAALEAVRGQTYEDWQHQYKTIEQPTLLLWGENDAVTRLEFGERLARDLPNAELVIYPQCGHFPMIEAAKQSTRDLLEFLLAPEAP